MEYVFIGGCYQCDLPSDTLAIQTKTVYEGLATLGDIYREFTGVHHDLSLMVIDRYRRALLLPCESLMQRDFLLISGYDGGKTGPLHRAVGPPGHAPRIGGDIIREGQL